MPGAKAGLADQRRLLVARHAANGNGGAEQVGLGRAELGGVVAHLGQKRARHAEDVEQRLVPLAGVDVEEAGARRVRRVGRVHASARQPPQEEGVDRAEGELAALRLGARARHVHRGSRRSWWRRNRDRAASRSSPSRPPRGRPRSALAGIRRAPVLPDDGVVDRPARRPLPDNGRLALVGDADGDDVARPRAGLAPSAARAVASAVRQMSSGSCSTQPEAGKCWGNSSCAIAATAKSSVKQHGAGGGRPLIDRQDIAPHAAPSPAALRSAPPHCRHSSIDRWPQGLVASPRRHSHPRPGLEATHERAVADRTTPRACRFWRRSLVYLRPGVLIVMLLGFSSGLPLALSGETLRVWMADRGVDLGTIGLLSLAGLPYTLKFLWAPIVDAWQVPYLSRRLGRRRSWLVASQLVLMATILFLGTRDPLPSPLMIGFAALLVAFASATQDIVVDAFRVQSLPTDEQAAGMASYVAAYRIGMLASGAGVIGFSAWLELQGLSKEAVWPHRLCRRGRCSCWSGLPRRCSRASPNAPRRGDRRGGRQRAAAPLRDREGAFVRVPVARRGRRHPRLRRALQAERCARRHHDGALRAVARLQQGDLCGDREGRWASRRCCIGGFAGGAIARALPLVDRAAGSARSCSRSPSCFRVARLAGAEHLGADGRHRARELHRRHRHGDLRRLSLRAVPQPAAYGDAVRAADGARLDRAHAVLVRHGVCGANARLAALLRGDHAHRAAVAGAVDVAAEARALPRARSGPRTASEAAAAA